MFAGGRRRRRARVDLMPKPGHPSADFPSVAMLVHRRLGGEADRVQGVRLQNEGEPWGRSLAGRGRGRTTGRSRLDQAAIRAAKGTRARHRRSALGEGGGRRPQLPSSTDCVAWTDTRPTESRWITQPFGLRSRQAAVAVGSRHTPFPARTPAILAGATTAARPGGWHAGKNPCVAVAVDSPVDNVVGAGIKPQSRYPDRAVREVSCETHCVARSSRARPRCAAGPRA